MIIIVFSFINHQNALNGKEITKKYCAAGEDQTT